MEAKTFFFFFKVDFFNVQDLKTEKGDISYIQS